MPQTLSKKQPTGDARTVLAKLKDCSAEQLMQRTIERRAIEAVNWGIPAVDTDLMLQAAIKAGAGPNQMTYWSRLFGWKNQTLTPNPDGLLFMLGCGPGFALSWTRR